MNRTGEEILALAEDFLSGRLSVNQLQELARERETDTAFEQEFQNSLGLLETLQEAKQNQQLRTQLRTIHTQQQQQNQTPKPEMATPEANRSIPLRTHYRRIAGIAAAVAVLASLGSFWALQGGAAKSGPTNRKLQQLGRELASVKAAQHQQMRQLESIQQNVASAPVAAPVRGNYGGTGFALTNDGYVATNYHVTEGADSIYLQFRNNYYKAYVIAFEPKNDLAVLKIEDPKFRFSKAGLPYTFQADKNRIGARIWSLGFPQDDVVYNEGYISSRNGYNGDSAQYRLELPASPGHSGAPILDNKGNILGMITGKESQSQGTTYAITSFALLRLLRNMPHEINLKLPQANKISTLPREQQVEKLQEFTCLVQVYKEAK